MDSYEEAVKHPKGDIDLAFCRDCGFIFNVAFDSTLTEYSSRYEETQAYSPTFNRFHLRLAESLVERYDLRHKRITEIGCGKGAFLALLCDLGENSGVGFDPAYKAGRNGSTVPEGITFIQDLYSEKYAQYCGDLICCKMTLEHIPNASAFVKMIRRSIGDVPSTVVFFQVPEAGEIFGEARFWDIYYEHCSYFTEESLRQLFTHSSFSVLQVATQYDNQYLSIEARPGEQQDISSSANALQIGDLHKRVLSFQSKSHQQISYWQERLQSYARNGKRIVLWGSGSKGVSFLTTLGVEREVDCVVDINPFRQGKFMPGSGHKIVGPDELKHRRPDLIVILNPIYRSEIQDMLTSLSISAELETL
jgi:SAM-dependent methyltransferase